jgi:hypothetical protein
MACRVVVSQDAILRPYQYGALRHNYRAHGYFARLPCSNRFFQRKLEKIKIIHA